MRNRLTLSPLFVAALAACQSTGSAPLAQDSTATPEAAAATQPAAELRAEPLPADPLFTEGVASRSEEPLAIEALAASVAPATQDDEPGSTQTTPAEGFERVEILRQKRVALSLQITELAQASFRDNDYDAALSQFSEALELDPSNQAARSGFRRVLAVTGDPLAAGADSARTDADTIGIRTQIIRMRAEESKAKGDIALTAGDFEEAIIRYRQAEVMLESNPLIETNDLDVKLVRALVKDAIAARDEGYAEEIRAKREASERALEEEKKAKRDGLRRTLSSFYENAHTAFQAQDYEEAERFARLILARDPANPQAERLLEIAMDAGHARTSELTRRNYREQWLKTMDEVSTEDIPVIQPLTFDYTTWRKALEREPLSARQLKVGADPIKEQVLGILETTPVAVAFEEAELGDIAEFLQTQSQVNFQLSSLAKEEFVDPIDLKLPGRRSVRLVLDSLGGTIENFAWKIEDGVVVLTTTDDQTGGQIRVTYSVSHLTQPIKDFVAPDINVQPTRGFEPPEEELPERLSSVVPYDVLEGLILSSIAPQSWDNDVANSVSVTERGQMVVNATPEVHALIADFLKDLSRATGTLVSIRTRFMRVEDNFLEDIGVDFRGLGQPGLGTNGIEFNDFGDGSSELGNTVGRTGDIGAFFDDGNDGSFRARVEDLYDSQLGTETFRPSGGLSFQWAFLNDLQLEVILRAVQKSERIETVTSPQITVNNGTRANVAVLNQVAYVQDFDVQIAQAASIADPIIKVIQDGVVLDVRPTVSSDRRFITLELRPTIAELQRPIIERPTTLGTQNTVTIQLPELEIQRVRTSIPIPDGSTVLLGGLKESTKQDLRTGVPILNKIPLLNFFFERKGTFVANRKLLILLTANIVIPEEMVPTAAELGRGN